MMLSAERSSPITWRWPNRYIVLPLLDQRDVEPFIADSQMFNVDNVGFGLLRDDGGYRYSIDVSITPAGSGCLFDSLT
jgi:hypothetical protein